MNKIITEITPLSDKDCFYLVDRYKDEFTYPIHRHSEYELNFISGCENSRRVVGDSIEILGNFDLVLVGHGIEHAWEQHECTSRRMREVTIQFSHDLFGDVFLGKNQLASIKDMLRRSANGLAFGMMTIMKVYNRLDRLTKVDNDFYRVMNLIEILYELSISEDCRELSSSSFSNSKPVCDSRRVRKVQEYIEKKYREEIRLNDLADLVGMTPTAFSRFFKLRTGKTISDYVIDVRLGQATRSLVDSTMSVAEICYDCGFNNVSHFNRIFRKKKGCTPKQFREAYKRRKLLV